MAPFSWSRSWLRSWSNRAVLLAISLSAATVACTIDTSALDGKAFRCRDGASCPSGTTCVNFLCEPTNGGGTDANPDSISPLSADLSCLGDDPGTMAMDPIVIEGEITNTAGTFVNNATVTVFDNAGAQLASGATDSFGDYSLSIPSSNTPVDGYIEVTGNTFLATRYIPPSPFHGIGSRETSTDIQLFTPAEVDAWYAASGRTRASSLGTFRLRITDCSSDAVEDAAVELVPAPESIVYGSGGGSLTMTDGLVLALSQATSTGVTVTASLGNSTFRARTLPAMADGPDTVTTMDATP